MSHVDVLLVTFSLKDSVPRYDILLASILKQCVSEYIAPLIHLIGSFFIVSLKLQEKNTQELGQNRTRDLFF